MSAPKEIRKLLREAEDAGWEVELRKGGHYRLKSPDGEHLVFLPSTPSDPRSWRNTRAQLRRCGLKAS